MRYAFLLGLLIALTRTDNISAQKPDTMPIRYLAMGDSYTVGTALDNSALRFPYQLAARLNADGIPTETPDIIAQNGWTSGDLMLATNMFQPENPYQLVSLLIGVNNQYQGLKIENYRNDITLLMQRAIQYAGGDPSRVFVFSIPDYGVTPFGKNKDASGEISRELDDYNRVNREVAMKLGISWYDITPISRKQSQYIARDGLHPSGKMYELWVDTYYDKITEKIKNQQQ